MKGRSMRRAVKAELMYYVGTQGGVNELYFTPKVVQC